MTVTLVFDTETTGIVLSREKPDHPGQPHLVQLGCGLYDAGGIEQAHVSLLVKPEGYTSIPEGAVKAHGITFELADALGLPLVVVMGLFSNLVKRADRHVGHNIEFDLKVVQAAFHRVGRPCPPMVPICTKDLAAPIVNLPPTARMLAAGFNKPKSPTLTECVRYFFDEDLAGAHDALVDTRACARVFFELERRGRLCMFEDNADRGARRPTT